MSQLSEESPTLTAQPRAALSRVVAFGALGFAELALIAYVYQFRQPLDCAIADYAALCALAGEFPVRALSLLTLAALCAPVRWSSVARLATAGMTAPARQLWALPHFLGLAVMLWPAVAMDPDLASRLPRAFAFWLPGGIAALVGGLNWAAPPAAWAAFARREGWPLPALLAIGFLLPSLVEVFDVFWHVKPLATFTFDGAAILTRVFTGEVYLDKPALVIGSGNFLVEVADSCSGVQGIALISSIIGLYLLAYRRELRFPHAFVLLPIAVVLSIALNILRIATLVWIGAAFSPDLAVNGFHSNAGWLLVTVLAFGVICASRAMPMLRRRDAGALRAPPPILSDPAAARIVPFIALMGSGLVASTFATIPGLFYPVRLLAIGLALAAFLPAYRAIDWRGSRSAVAIGTVVGLLWLITRHPPSEGDLALAERLSRLSTENLAIWILFRVLGTMLIVPVVEELFFRDYILRLGANRGWSARVIALIGSAVLFALLHDRWLAAGLTGLVFGLLAWRSGRLGPAVWAHVSANAVIAAWAIGTGDWSVI